MEIPLDSLVPMVENRMAYLKWIHEEILNESTEPIQGLDIGTGASCIYPLLGVSMYSNYEFLATEQTACQFSQPTAR